MGTIATLATADAASSGSSGLLILALPLLLLAWLFWTSSRKQRRMREFVSSLSVGDDVVTSSGMYGTIRHLDDASAYIEIAEGIVIRFDRRAVAMKQPEGATVVADDAAGTDTEQ